MSHRCAPFETARAASTGPLAGQLAEAGMSREDTDPPVDLSLSPERMVRIRDGVRELLVQHIHTLRIAARAFRKAGIHDRARRCEVEAGRLARAVGALDNPMSMLTFPPEKEPERRDGE